MRPFAAGPDTMSGEQESSAGRPADEPPAAEPPTVATKPGPPAGRDPVPPPAGRAGFLERGRLRRRVRFLRRRRELQLRDLGGLTFELARLGRRNDALVDAKTAELRATTDELRGLESALNERRPVEELRIAGIGGACPSCGAIHGSADRFCAACGRTLAEPGADGAPRAGEIRAGDQRAR